MKFRSLICVALGTLFLAPAAAAHVTLNPGEWEAGGFARFAVRVPNERDNANTTEITMQFPESVIEARFQPVPGWERTIEMATLDEPIVEEGEEPITERIASVTWSSGTIASGEFQEFGVSFQVPETPGEDLMFPAIQTYSNGEVVRWIDPDSEAESPAPRVAVSAPEEEEGGGSAQPAAQSPTPTAAASEDDDGSGLATVALILGIAGLAAGLAALAFIFLRTPSRI